MPFKLAVFAATFAFFGATQAAPYRAPVYQLPPPEAAEADANIILVRHAYPACHDVQCGLTEDGDGQAARLGRIVAALKKDGLKPSGVYASGTCRTVLTATPAANVLELPVKAYPAREGIAFCAYLGDGEGLKRPSAERRPEKGAQTGEGEAASRDGLIDFLNADAAGDDSTRRFAVAVDHSNFVCEWFLRLGVDPKSYAKDCVFEGGLKLTDYADIFWLYDAKPGPGVDWRLIVLEDGFDIDKKNAYEP